MLFYESEAGFKIPMHPDKNISTTRAVLQNLLQIICDPHFISIPIIIIYLKVSTKSCVQDIFYNYNYLRNSG